MAEEEIKETAAAAEAPAAAAEDVKVKKGKKRIDIQGIACVNATFNNTIVSITDARGNVVAWGSPGNSGFKGSRKSSSLGVPPVTPASRAPARALRSPLSSLPKLPPTRLSTSACARWTSALRVPVVAANPPSALSRMRASKSSLFET